MLKKREKFFDSESPAGRPPAESRATRPPLLRMVRIHDLLSAGRYPNCSHLAREFEVSTKTIQRDVDFMRDQLMLPIDYDRVRHGFAYSRGVAQFPLLTVSEGELVALLVAQKAVEQYRGTSFEKPLHTAFQKLVSSLGDEANVSLHELSEAVSFHYAGVPHGQIKVFESLAAAVMTNELVEFDYFSLRARKPERRRVAPYHLACITNQWYLIARDQDREDIRTFALTRVGSVRRLKVSFERPPDFSISKMFSGSFAAFEAGETERVRVRFDAAAARLVSERQWHKSQRIRSLGQAGIELTMQVGIAPDLESWILGWGDQAEVIEPVALRQRIAETIRSMSVKYDQSHS
jgi:predicted DNA-binding transcriptional regulator YafY